MAEFNTDAEGIATAKMKKVRALLAQAEDPAATPEEAAAFSAKAFELMATYGIEIAMLEAEADRHGARTRPESRTFHVQRPWALDGAQLLNQLARALRCRAIRLPSGNGEPIPVEVFGFASDLDRLDVLYTSLLLQMHTGLASAVAHKPTHEHGKAFNKSWLMGFISTVSYRVREAERHAERAAKKNESTNHSSNSTELVLVDRVAKVEQVFDKAHPRTVKGTKSKSRGTGYSSGVRAGEKADIG